MRDNYLSIKSNQIALIFFAALMVFTPFVAYQKLVFWTGAFGVWLLTTLSIERNWLKRSYKYMAVLMIWAVMYRFVKDSRVINSGEVYFSKFYAFTFWTYIWSIVYVFYKKHLNIAIFPLKIILLLIFVSCIFTIIGNIIIPEASRSLAGGISNEASYLDTLKGMYIGDYGFIYGMVFLAMPVFLCLKFEVLNKKYILVFLLVVIVTVVLGAFFTGLFLMFTALTLSFANPRNSSKYILALLFIGLIVLIFYDTIMSSIIDVGDAIGSESLSRRAEQMLKGTYQSDYDAKNDLSRLERAYNAVINFLNSPILGQMIITNRKMYDSGHSEFLGYFEKFGIFALSYVWFFKSFYKQCANRLRNEMVQKYYFLYFIVVISFLFLDTFDVATETGCIVFFVAPLIFQYIDYQVNECKTQRIRSYDKIYIPNR